MGSVVSELRVAVLASGMAIAMASATAKDATASAAPASTLATMQQTGPQVYEAQKCSLCHSIAGKGNAKGPLDKVGAKYSAADLKLWITSPAEMGKKHNATRKPPMKSFASLAPADVDALVAYLQTLKQ
jgi:mono/diheme cytochrome c family protein